MNAKMISFILILALVFGCLAGCAGSEVSDNPDESPQVTASGAETEGDGAEEAVEHAFDYAALYAAHDPDEVVLTVNGLEATWDECVYWLVFAAQNMEYYLGTEIDPEAECPISPDETNREYLSGYAYDALVDYKVIESKADEMGITLSDDDKAFLKSVWDTDVETYAEGDEEAFADILAETYLNEDIYNYMNSCVLLYENISEELYGEQGKGCSDEDVLEYAGGAGYMRAKHILFKTSDDKNESLTDEEKAEKLAEAEKTLAELQSAGTGTALEARFTELMVDLSEDGGAASYADGYYFLPGEMVEEFENATLELDEGEMSGIVESQFGYHIILRLPLRPDGVIGYSSTGSAVTLRSAVADSMFAANLESWANEAEVVFGEAFADGKLAKDLRVPQE